MSNSIEAARRNSFIVIRSSDGTGTITYAWEDVANHFIPQPAVHWTFQQTGLQTGAHNVKFDRWWREETRPTFPAAEAFFFGVLLGLLITLAICRKAVFK